MNQHHILSIIQAFRDKILNGSTINNEEIRELKHYNNKLKAKKEEEQEAAGKVTRVGRYERGQEVHQLEWQSRKYSGSNI